jgi:hypothetical protein
MKKICSTALACIAATCFSFAQTPAAEVEMADTLHQNGKIYVVVAVVVIIFAGLVWYMIGIDRRLRRIEKK